MNSFLSYLSKHFFYSGLTKENFISVKKSAYKVNYGTAKFIHIFLGFVFLVLYLTTLGENGLAKSISAIYLVVFIYILLSTILYLFCYRSDKLPSQINFFITVILLLVAGMAMSLDTPEMMGVTFIVLLVVQSFFIIGSPIHSILLTITAALVYILLISRVKEGDVFRKDALNTVYFSALSIIICLINNHSRFRELLSQKEVEVQRDTDELTGLMSKFALTTNINEYVTKKDNVGYVFLLDIDYFKSINDNYGHDWGDKVLKNLGTIINDTFEDVKIKGRFGGDEFIILLSDSDASIVADKADRLIKAVNKRLHTPNSNEIVGISVGITKITEEDESYNSVLKRADVALYISKNNGRNQFSFTE